MAERRMFAKTIVLSDAFLDMPLSARCLYFTLGMLADDDGFVNSPKSIMRQSGASIDDINILLAKRFILAFDSGVIVIKHWRIHNYIQKDRYKESKYIEEKAAITVDRNGAYTECIHDVYNLDTQVRLGKDSIDKVNIEESIKEESTLPSTPPSKHKYGEYGCVLLTTSQYDKLISDYGDKNYIDKVINRVDELCKMTGNKYKWKDFNLVIRKVIRENWSIVKDLKIERNDCGEVF